MKKAEFKLFQVENLFVFGAPKPESTSIALLHQCYPGLEEGK